MSKNETAKGRELAVWRDHFAHLKGTKVSFDEIVKERGFVEKARLRHFIADMVTQIDDSGLEEVELLLVLLARYDTSRIVQLKWHRTDIGQQFKDTYVRAKVSFLKEGF